MGKGGEGPQHHGKEKKITLDELSHHRTPNDAWMSYRGKVYDVSKWEDHPGEQPDSYICSPRDRRFARQPLIT